MPAEMLKRYLNLQGDAAGGRGFERRRLTRRHTAATRSVIRTLKPRIRRRGKDLIHPSGTVAAEVRTVTGVPPCLRVDTSTHPGRKRAEVNAAVPGAAGDRLHELILGNVTPARANRHMCGRTTPESETVLIIRIQKEVAGDPAVTLPFGRDGETRPALWRLAGSPAHGSGPSHTTDRARPLPVPRAATAVPAAVAAGVAVAVTTATAATVAVAARVDPAQLTVTAAKAVMRVLDSDRPQTCAHRRISTFPSTAGSVPKKPRPDGTQKVLEHYSHHTGTLPDCKMFAGWKPLCSDTADFCRHIVPKNLI